MDISALPYLKNLIKKGFMALALAHSLSLLLLHDFHYYIVLQFCYKHPFGCAEALLQKFYDKQLDNFCITLADLPPLKGFFINIVHMLQHYP